MSFNKIKNTKNMSFPLQTKNPKICVILKLIDFLFYLFCVWCVTHEDKYSCPEFCFLIITLCYMKWLDSKYFQHNLSLVEISNTYCDCLSGLCTSPCTVETMETWLSQRIMSTQFSLHTLFLQNLTVLNHFGFERNF